MRLDLDEIPPVLASDTDSRFHGFQNYELTPCSPEFDEWRKMNGITHFRAVANVGLLHEHHKAANDEVRPAYVSIFFNSDRDALAFKMRWL